MVSHSERCKECKKRVFELLTEVFGEVNQNYNINLSCSLDAFKNKPCYAELEKIYLSLQNYRGYDSFVHSYKLSHADFFVVNPGFIVEFDESQHFTVPRAIALENYPENLRLGFDKHRWIEICKKLDRHDNNPGPWRDEQRAWYETLKDFAPVFLNLKPTIRLYPKDCIWCELNPNSDKDLKKFKEIIGVRE